MTINERIKQLRKSLGLSQAEFGKNIGVSRDVINNLDRSESAVEPKPLMIEHICSVYNVNPNWLIHGEGEMFRTPSVDEELAAFVAEVISDDNDFKKRVFYAMSRMDDAAWDAFERFWNDMRDADIGRKKEKDTE